MPKNDSQVTKLAFKFVLIIGIVNLFADMTYEGARSITDGYCKPLSPVSDCLKVTDILLLRIRIGRRAGI